MSLTYQQIYEQYSQVQFIRRMYIKRLNPDGTYEANFTQINQGLMEDGSVQSIDRSLPNNSWQFGYVTVSNVGLQVLSAYQEFASEQDPNSIFFGFIRHHSIIKIVDALIDKYTDPLNPVEASVTTFIGLLDSTTASTEQGYESIDALDFLSILSTTNVSQLTLTQTTLSDLVYEIMNNPLFTQFFSVSNSSTYINPGFDLTGIDLTQYTGSVADMLEDLAKGHSIFFVNPNDNFFYFVPITPTADVQWSFLENNNRKLSITGYREGIDRQITNWYWDSIEDALAEDWTSVDWTGSQSDGWIHTTGNTTVLSESTPAINDRLYDIIMTVSARTAGSFSFLFGGQTLSSVTASQSITVLTIGIDNLQITPTSDFDGTVIVSIKRNISAIVEPQPINPISQTFKVDGITDDDERQLLLNFILTLSENKKPYFNLQIPYFPLIQILDRVKVQAFGSAPPFAARWGMFQFTPSTTTNPNAAPRWFKPAGIRISEDRDWVVRSINHDNSLTTTLELELIP